MIEIDARKTKDGVLIVNHDADIKGYDEFGSEVKYVIAETDYYVIRNIRLLKERVEENRIPTLQDDRTVPLSDRGWRKACRMWC